jgi:hypothetical protein
MAPKAEEVSLVWAFAPKTKKAKKGKKEISCFIFNNLKDKKNRRSADQQRKSASPRFCGLTQVGNFLNRSKRVLFSPFFRLSVKAILLQKRKN